MRLAVYSDDAFARVDGTVRAEMAFALFAAALDEHVGRLIIAGRLDPGPDRGNFALPSGVVFEPLPFWSDLARPLSIAHLVPRTLHAFWRVLDGADAVWLLGPSPLGLLFAGLAMLRSRRVVLGVRMSYPDYVRNRHPGRPGLDLLARILDGAWRALAMRVPTVVVGAELAARYRRARCLLSTPVSLVTAGDVLADEDLARRDYDGELRVLAVGRIDSEKNPLLLADVLARLRAEDPRWRLVVCGDGPLREALAARLAQLGVESAADLLGQVPPERGLRDVYRSCHAFLHVSWTEGIPQVLFEAFAAGLPVVATDVGGVREATGAEAALLIAPGDADAAAAALRRVALDQALRARMVAAGLKRARSQSLEATSARVARFIAGAPLTRSEAKPVSRRRRRRR